MTYNFDTSIQRRGTGSAKWELFDEDVIPLWVADMDFRSPEPVIRALHERAEQGTFGYHMDSPVLRKVLCERMAKLYRWQIKPEEIVFLPGLVAAFNAVCAAVGEPGSGVLMLTPIYHPMISAPTNQRRTAQFAELVCTTHNGVLRYEIDFDAVEQAITPETRMLLFCSPHNPIGRVWTHAELERLAELCQKHNLVICSDEIHCDILLNDIQHTPFGAIAPEVAARTVTLMAPSKVFNLPGLGLGFAIIQDEAIRKQVQSIARLGLMPLVNTMGFAAALAAYRDSQDWLDGLLSYLKVNRAVLTDFVAEHFPGVRMTEVEATYLAWLDFRETGLPQKSVGLPHVNEYFLNEARVAVQDGALFGRGGEGFLRLNFGCTQATLLEALERMRAALVKLSQ